MLPQYAVAVEAQMMKRQLHPVELWLHAPPVYAWHAACASVWLWVFVLLQS